MRQIKFLVLLALFSACNNTDSGSHSPDADKSIKDSIGDTFIESDSLLSKYLKELLNDELAQGYSNKGNVVFKNGRFAVLQIQEETEYVVNEYVIFLNVSGLKTHIGLESVEAKLKQLYKPGSISNIAVLKGRLSKTIDFDGDGGQDFILTTSFSEFNAYSGTSVLLFYDGKNNVQLTAIEAISNYEESSSNGLVSGFKETFVMDKSSQGKVVVSHKEYYLLPIVNNDSITVEYNMVWEIENTNLGNVWSCSLQPVKSNLKGIKDFPVYFDLVVQNNGELLTKEHCQNGGKMGYQLSKHEIKGSGVQYAFNEKEDDLGEYIVVNCVELTSNKKGLLMLRQDMTNCVDGRTGCSGIEKGYRFVLFEQNSDRIDLYRLHSYSSNGVKTDLGLFTVNSDLYEMQKCN